MRRHVMNAEKLHADDTPVPVLAPSNGKTKTGRLWTYVRDDRPGEIRARRRCGSPTRRIARANIRKHTCKSLRTGCGRMVTRGTIQSMRVDRSKGVHGACSQAVLRTVRGSQVCGSESNARADRGLVCHRGGDPGTSRRRTARGPESTQPAYFVDRMLAANGQQLSMA